MTKKHNMNTQIAKFNYQVEVNKDREVPALVKFQSQPKKLQ